MYDQAQLFGSDFISIASLSKAVSGFGSTGLWPFNADVFATEDFAASQITDEPTPDQNVTENQDSAANCGPSS